MAQSFFLRCGICGVRSSPKCLPSAWLAFQSLPTLRTSGVSIQSASHWICSLIGLVEFYPVHVQSCSQPRTLEDCLIQLLATFWHRYFSSGTLPCRFHRSRTPKLQSLPPPLNMLTILCLCTPSFHCDLVTVHGRKARCHAGLTSWASLLSRITPLLFIIQNLKIIASDILSCLIIACAEGTSNTSLLHHGQK